MAVYITSSGHYLPGPAISNDEIEEVLGYVHGRPSRLKDKILKANGIKTRHYAIDREHETKISNSEMAALAAENCLESASVNRNQIGMLAAATSQGDLVLPGFGSMVQAELKLPDVELLTAHGICSSGMMALKSAYTSMLSGEHSASLVVASELSSRLFKASRYEAVGEKIDFNAEFLRWMLSDGAGSFLLEDKPRGICGKIDWIKSFSHADAYQVCMSVGAVSSQEKTWQDYPTYTDAERAGALLIRQDVRLLDNIVKLGVDGYLRLIDKGFVDPDSIDHVLCHYSSHHFKGRIFEMMERAGVAIPENKWFSNLYTRGNTGCASIFIMIDEFLKTQEYSVGDKILCMVPESGRFNTAYMQITIKDGNDER
ncbi:MAG: beta-ketoacyl-ACP synthase III [Cellvibrionaceae bacterium]